jgi:hypothetical protein
MRQLWLPQQDIGIRTFAVKAPSIHAHTILT